MTRTGSRRAVAVAAAALCGGAATYAVVPDGWSAPARYAATDAAAGQAAVRSPSSSPSPTDLPSASSSPAPAAPPAGNSPAQEPAAEPAPPTRVTVDRLGIDLPVVPQGVDPQGRMALPEDPAVAGWYRFGPAPATPEGAVVVAAHVDSRERGIGPFVRLSSARPGDRVLVQAGGTQWRYEVTGVVRVDKDEDISRYFARDGAPRLHLVTCIGRYDPATGYEANLVVVADRADGAG